MKKIRAIYRFLNRLLGVAFAIWLTLCFLLIYSSHEVFKSEKFGLYLSDPTSIPSGFEFETMLQGVETALQKSEFYDETITANIYFFDKPYKLALISPLTPQAFALTYPFSANIYFTTSDFAKNTVQSGDQLRDLDGTITHEMTHNLVSAHYGFIEERQLPTWMREGYSEYIAFAAPVYQDERWAMVCDNAPEPTADTFYYFLYRAAVTYLIDEKKMSMSDIFGSDLNFGDVLNDLKAAKC